MAYAYEANSQVAILCAVVSFVVSSCQSLWPRINKRARTPQKSVFGYLIARKKTIG